MCNLVESHRGREIGMEEEQEEEEEEEDDDDNNNNNNNAPHDGLRERAVFNPIP